MATSAKVPPTGPVEKNCIVCGQGSHRADWQSRDNPSCDHHSVDEVKAALAKLSGIKAVPSSPSPAPAVSSSKTPNGPTK